MTLPQWTQDPLSLKPMLAQLASPQEVPLRGERWAFERKYDGIRCLSCATEAKGVALLSRNGIDKARQFAEVADAVRLWRDSVGPLIVDGEIVALDEAGQPASFTRLQQRLPRLARSHELSETAPGVRLLVFDLLRIGTSDLRAQPFQFRRAALEEVFGRASAATKATVELALSVVGEGEALWQRAQEEGWEGLIIKDRQSAYASGARSSAWRKLKVLQRGIFVVGGFTSSKSADRPFGALVLGEKARDGTLRPVGNVGTGFSAQGMQALHTQLLTLQTNETPFSSSPVLMGPARWVQPQLEAEVTFVEWTPAGQLRHPVFLGLRAPSPPRPATRSDGSPPAATRGRRPRQKSEAGDVTLPEGEVARALSAVLSELERTQKDGRVRLPSGETLAVSNLHKPFWPSLGLTKGDLFRYYLEVSPFLLPVVEGRPLVMKRHPEGAEGGEPFYQHRAPDPLPKGARAERLPGDDVPARLVGGDLFTLLYMVQLGAISQDPWFSRVESLDAAEEVAFDLDPMPGVPFAKVRDVALWLHEVLLALEVPHHPKTSGASGIHVFVPLAPGTAYEPARLFTQLVSAYVVRKHGDVATVERSVAARGDKVYIDCLQNIRGKTLACAYSARASAFAGASTPLTWQEVQAGVRPEDFTILTLPKRIRGQQDLWAPVVSRTGRLDLVEVLERLRTLA